MKGASRTLSPVEPRLPGTSQSRPAFFRSLPAAGDVQGAVAVACSVFLVGCVAAFFWSTRHWPLVNDPALMHYVVFLMGRGMAPYRDIHDINLPGAYAPEWLSMTLASLLHVSQAAMWRGMDWLLLGLAALAMLRIATRFSWFAGVVAGSLFALYHGRDGVGQAAQRDLILTVLLLWATEQLLRAMRGCSAWPLVGFGLCLGAAASIKPVALVYGICLLPLLFQKGRTKAALAAAAGFALPVLATTAFLLHWHAVEAFRRMVEFDLPYHVSLAHGTVSQLVWAASISSVKKLICLLGLTLLLAGRWRGSFTAFAWPTSQNRKSQAWTCSPERCLLLLGVLLGLFCFVAQGKGYPYQRYPFVAFLFLLAALEFTAAAAGGPRLLRAAGVAGLAFCIVLCAPVYLRGAIQARWSSPVLQIEDALRRQAAAGDLRSLQGKVQCMDVATGCTDALLALGLGEATGTIYDEFLFPQVPAGWSVLPAGSRLEEPLPAALVAGRQAFQKALDGNPPRVIIVTSWLFPEGPGDYRKLMLWPWFEEYLQAYRLVEQQAFPRGENGPLGFRVYVRREAKAGFPLGVE